MHELYIGCGGWAYANFGDAPGIRLENYSKLFNFVEVNSTFYQIPNVIQCQKWRTVVPNDFTFSVKCNKELSHKMLLNPSKKAINIFNKMVKICEALKAIALVIQTPLKFLNNLQNLKNAEKLFAEVESPIALTWEVRGYEKFPQIHKDLVQIFSEYNIAHCTDIAKDMPLYSTNLIYSRIFGHGNQNMWQFDDDEIKALHRKAEDLRKESKVVLSFHTMRMERDTARYQEYKNKKVLIPVTDYFGLNSIISVIKEYNKYPISKDELLEAHGWKLVDLNAKNRIRAYKLLNKLPNKKFSNFQAIKTQLSSLFKNYDQKQLEEFI